MGRTSPLGATLEAELEATPLRERGNLWWKAKNAADNIRSLLATLDGKPARCWGCDPRDCAGGKH